MKPENVTCPDCGGPMVSLKNSKDGTRFWGCKDYPACRGTRDTDGESAEDRGGYLPSERMRNGDRSRWRS